MSSNNKANYFKGAVTRSKLAARTSPTPDSTSANPLTDLSCTEEKHTDPNFIEEIWNMSATLQIVAADVVSIKERTKELKDSVENILIRLGEVEQRVFLNSTP